MAIEEIFSKEKFLLGKRVTELRKKLGLSQKELGERCQINRTEISRIETGNKNLEFYTVIKLAEGLRIELISLFDYTDKRILVKTKKPQDINKRFENEKKALGNRLQSLRKLRNILQVDIDIAIGLPDSDVSRIENAIANMKFFSLFRIAEVLQVEVADLFDYDRKYL